MAAPQPRCLRGRGPGTVVLAQAPLPASCGGPGWMGPTPHAAPRCPPPLGGPAPTLQRVVRGPGGAVRRPPRSALVHSCPRSWPRTPLSSLGSSCPSPAPSRPPPRVMSAPLATSSGQSSRTPPDCRPPAPSGSTVPLGSCPQSLPRPLHSSGAPHIRPPHIKWHFPGLAFSQFAENGAPSAIAFGLVTFSLKFWIHPPPSLLGPLQIG